MTYPQNYGNLTACKVKQNLNIVDKPHQMGLLGV